MARKKNYISKNVQAGTPQTEPLEGQVANSAGGFSFQIDDWTKLQRFLVLGSEGGTYYINERKLTKDHAKNVLKLIKEDGKRVVQAAVDISVRGRAPKNDPALFVHAMASIEGDLETRRLAYDTLPQIARIGTHLFTWVAFRHEFGGWGSGAKAAVSSWYNDKEPEKLGYQLIKYAQRNGWTHMDALRLAHVKPQDPVHDALFNFAKAEATKTEIDSKKQFLLPQQVIAAMEIKTAKEKDVIKLIRDYNLPREVVPSEFLNSPSVWEALLDKMPITAMIRNLGKMSAIGLVKPHSSATKLVVLKLNDTEAVKRSRIHPVQVLAALKTYSLGRGIRGKLTWNTVSRIVDALDDTFYAAFDNVEPANKRFLLGVDVSGSMGWGNCAGLESLTCAEGAAVMAMVTARLEPEYEIMGFASSFMNLGIRKKDSLHSVLEKTNRQNFGGTDCALPMIHALNNKISVDAFCVYTDSETWSGNSGHPVEALVKYRKKMGIPAKLVVVGLAGNDFTIANPEDSGTLDVVGFDSAAPQIIADFVRE